MTIKAQILELEEKLRKFEEYIEALEIQKKGIDDSISDHKASILTIEDLLGTLYEAQDGQQEQFNTLYVKFLSGGVTAGDFKELADGCGFDLPDAPPTEESTEEIPQEAQTAA